jgi:hypothetical protein
VYEQTPGYAPVLIVASLEDRPVAKLLAVIRRSVRLFPPSFIHRCEVYGTGEYFDESLSSDEIFGQMLEHLTNEVLKDCFLIEFRNLPTALSGYRHFRHNDYFPINWIRVYNSLHNRPPEQRIDSKRLRQVNRSVKLGAYTQPAKTEEDLEIENAIKDKEKITVYNKADLFEKDYDGGMVISAKTGKGIEALKQKLYDVAFLGGIDKNAEYITEERHYNALIKAQKFLEEALKNLGTIPLDLISEDVKNVWLALGEITGKTASEEIIDEIFSKFCVGK